jgi:hypothetical protein
MLTEFVHEGLLSELLYHARPSQSLRPFIECYRETRCSGLPMPVRYLPNVAFVIRFNLGGTFHLRSAAHSFAFDDHLFIPSQHTWIDDGCFFAIQFRFGLLPYLPGGEQGPPPEWPVTIRGLLSDNYINSIEQANSFEERIKLTEDYFSGLYDQNKKWVDRYQVVEDVVNYFQQGQFDAQRLDGGLKQNFVSSRSLQRYFLKNFGLTPKAAYCILRMRRALQAYFNDPKTFRVYEHDFYDYSHFYKEVKKIVGVGLSQLKGPGAGGQ